MTRSDSPKLRGVLRFSMAATLLAGSTPPISQALTGGTTPQARDVLRYPVDVGAVALDVVVTDRNGDFVAGLKADDFTVLELGVPQELAFFTADPTPVTVLLLLDSSASVRSNLIPVQKAAHRFIGKLPRGDRARIGFFHDQVIFGPRFTDDMKEHSAMINRMQPQRSTHLYDALVEALEILEPVPGRKALLIFSDGDDEGSQTSKNAALEAARRSHASVYSVGLLGWSTEDGMYANEDLLEEIARLTGGKTFFPRKEEQMRKAFDLVRDELHHQYRMGYLAQGGAEEPGRWRDIQVRLEGRRDLVVRSRLGYYDERKEASQ